MVQLLLPAFPAGRVGFGLLALRLVAGAAFLFHGWPKIQNPLGWMDRPDAASGMPGVLQAAAALSEFGGGAALILGLLTPLAALGIAGTMVTAIGTVHLPKRDPFVPPPGWQGGSWELAAVYLAVVTLLLMAGPGRFSLDALLFGRTPGASPGRLGQERAAPAG